MSEGLEIHERERSPILNHAVDYLCNVDGASLDSAVDFGVVTTSSQLLDCGFPALDDYPPNPTASQWPMLSPLSMLHSTGQFPSLTLAPFHRPARSSLHLCSDNSTQSNMLPEVVAEATLSGTPRASQSSTQKVCTGEPFILTSCRAPKYLTESSPQGDRARRKKGSQRRHYAVEKRYRSTLDGKYAALARTLSSEATRRICQTDSPEWAVQLDGPSSLGPNDESATMGSRQRKTTTLSVTIETINILSRCCRRKAMNLEQLRCSVHEMRNRVQQMLEANTPLSHEQQQSQQPQQHSGSGV
ncbi:hypothetical protein BJ170DRAFT_638179 [Xylariales sp. AK1849]|nr:hypothetical protein BJ170DRAFT_638179 [Xylariales sp. AK1849]